MADRAQSATDIKRRLAGTLARAVIELGFARLRLPWRHSRRMISVRSDDVEAQPGAGAIVDQVAFIIPRVAARLPWRSDCLVQALAAKNWLACEGVIATLQVGVRKDLAGNLAAHAWLSVGHRIVVGGDIRGYALLTRD